MKTHIKSYLLELLHEERLSIACWEFGGRTEGQFLSFEAHKKQMLSEVDAVIREVQGTPVTDKGYVLLAAAIANWGNYGEPLDIDYDLEVRG